MRFVESVRSCLWTECWNVQDFTRIVSFSDSDYTEIATPLFRHKYELLISRENIFAFNKSIKRQR